MNGSFRFCLQFKLHSGVLHLVHATVIFKLIEVWVTWSPNVFCNSYLIAKNMPRVPPHQPLCFDDSRSLMLKVGGGGLETRFREYLPSMPHWIKNITHMTFFGSWHGYIHNRRGKYIDNKSAPELLLLNCMFESEWQSSRGIMMPRIDRLILHTFSGLGNWSFMVAHKKDVIRLFVVDVFFRV